MLRKAMRYTATKQSITEKPYNRVVKSFIMLSSFNLLFSSFGYFFCDIDAIPIPRNIEDNDSIDNKILINLVEHKITIK